MKFSDDADEAHPWRIREIAPDFRLEDAWHLPAEGDAEDFGALVDLMTSLDPAGASRPTRLLFAVRERLGTLLKLDEKQNELPIPGTDETSLAARLPDDLRGSASPASGSTPFVPLYRTGDEWAAELSNATVHGVIHLAWVPQGERRYRGQLGVYVKPRGRLGAAYMVVIKPLRHLIVYPALMRQIEREWRLRRESGR
ncbi:MAG: DUF2867 domain-containing protein [Aeromicrobium sp.]